MQEPQTHAQAAAAPPLATTRLAASRSPCSGHPWPERPPAGPPPGPASSPGPNHIPSHVSHTTRTRLEKSTSRSRRMGDAPTVDWSLVQPISLTHGPPTDLSMATLNHLDASHSPMSSPLAEATQEPIKTC
ncbi:hypothetical protein F511_05322 [Dorcoceras hygrometricum]|uniref:Uncharacterized protein n=1 Tax=Dorcoceras hygrometricum TaxID=472368 RepID=A0A2Z7ANE8_9LAMI|nr:hypothetical protein F511_05322 [Dorcoceras hygrometricum]